MENTKSIECTIDGKSVKFESGHLAQQAHGSVTAQIGDSVLFSAVTTGKPREGINFFPMQVEYREKFYAAGRFPGGFFKREARPSEKEVLTARLTDRPIRPLFPKGFMDELQINNTVLSVDGENDPDMMSINAASAALTISDIPFYGPIGAVRIGRVKGEFIINPTHSDLEESDLDLVYAATRDLPIMIEGSAQEISEEDIVTGMKQAHEAVVQLIDAQLELRRALGMPDKELPPYDQGEGELVAKIRGMAADKIKETMEIVDKHERQDAVAAIKDEIMEQLSSDDPELDESEFGSAFHDVEIEQVRRLVLEDGKRIGGRGMHEIRDLDIQVGMLPRTHGSAVFTRGETQALGVVTLGTGRDSQRIDAVSGGVDDKKFLLHYNFPPYSVGECGRLGSTSRREIGHGNLAERSILQVMPEDYPYAVRIVSEVMGSNGSSSMASACVGSLALMDCGVPIKAPVAGISVGLFTGNDKAQLVTDILGVEDHCGDMDFKVVGTRKGITGFQVDLKIGGLDWDLMAEAFGKARDARMRILDAMEAVIAAPREELSEYAPRFETVSIPVDKIGALIGPGGKNIKALTETYEVEIDIEEDGSVAIFSLDAEKLRQVKEEIDKLTAEAEIGKLYHGTVTGVKDFGAFVEILPGKDGLVHISEMADFRVKSVDDICKMGDKMWVKCLDVDSNGKIRLSRRAAMEEKDAEEE